MAQLTRCLLLPALLLLSLPAPPAHCLSPVLQESSSKTPPSPTADLRGDAEVSVDPHESNSPHPLNRILQPDGRSQGEWNRKLLQTGSGPYAPLSVAPGGRTCILFRARKMAVSHHNLTAVDLTKHTFGPAATVDTTDSTCSQDRAVLSLNFGDVEHLKGLVIRLEMSNTVSETTEQTWFTLDSVQIHYNRQLEARFDAPEIYAPATNSYHCQRVSSQQKYDSMLLPRRAGVSEGGPSEGGPSWHITFTDFQIQAFELQSSQRFGTPRDCASALTPAVLMGLVTSLILLLVLAYALHMVVHLKHIERYEEHKTTVYFPRSPDADRTDKPGS
ncbi:ATPase H+ transporting accessory protein 1 like b [Conger conger]|uniref:ATPase H+ transporting accessory protein 1 like b n=1 Tax=Conger conger TaxID=82655 RepID=UPI002A598819|nr:ATPase H+ transporting accessory protein 1 like b [Conger conger]